MIILEGPDGGGKSTLLEKLRPVFREYEFVHSGGPVQSPADLYTRMRKQHPRQVRDRHFCISSPIYSEALGRQCWVDDRVIESWLLHRPFVIFCFAPTDEMPPQTGVHDTPEHVAGITANREKILDAYRQLATQGDLPYPAVVYRWDNYDFVVEQALKHEKEFM